MSEETDAIDCWCPKPSPGLQSRENAFGLPTVVPRTPVNLMRECEMAYDDGLVLAALTLVVTVPDVCSRIDGTDYRTWAAEYLHLENDGKRMDDERNDLKSEADVERGFERFYRTASSRPRISTSFAARSFMQVLPLSTAKALLTALSGHRRVRRVRSRQARCAIRAYGERDGAARELLLRLRRQP